MSLHAPVHSRLSVWGGGGGGGLFAVFVAGDDATQILLIIKSPNLENYAAVRFLSNLPIMQFANYNQVLL